MYAEKNRNVFRARVLLNILIKNLKLFYASFFFLIFVKILKEIYTYMIIDRVAKLDKATDF